jgi:uncharacterized surface protein with fasciclin (FAS1) repeats
MNNILKFLTVSVLAATLFACSNDDDDDIQFSPALDNIVEVAIDNGSFTTLVAALEAAGLDSVLSDETRDFTVFAPTDAAFDALLAELNLTAGELLASPYLADILLYHVVADAEIDSTTAIAAAGTTLTMANTDDVGVSLKGMDDMDLFINASRVELPDVAASNGVIHVIDAVLLPTEDDENAATIAGVAVGNENFSTLVTALQAADLVDVLADEEGKFTVFAPTNAAFAAAGITEEVLATLAIEDLQNILLYHVISGVEVNAAAAIAIAGNTVEMANEDRMALSLTGSSLFANLSEVSAPNVDASNGIIHVIDSVLMPPADAPAPTQTIAEIAQGSEDFETLVLALGAAGLVDTLNDPAGDFTVFAPTDEAFAALLADLGIDAATLLGSEDLDDILLKHVVSGTVDSVTAFTLNGADVVTLNPAEETVTIEITNGEFRVDGARVTTFDILATNGIIHVIDAVITLD